MEIREIANAKTDVAMITKQKAHYARFPKFGKGEQRSHNSNSFVFFIHVNTIVEPNSSVERICGLC